MHDKPEKKTRIGARFGAQQTAKKGTHWSTIWCSTNREKKHALEHDLVPDKPWKKKARIGARFGARQTAKKKCIGARFGAQQTAK